MILLCPIFFMILHKIENRLRSLSLQETPFCEHGVVLAQCGP